MKRVAKPVLQQARTGAHGTGMQSGAAMSLSSAGLWGALVSLRRLSLERTHSDTLGTSHCPAGSAPWPRRCPRRRVERARVRIIYSESFCQRHRPLPFFLNRVLLVACLFWRKLGSPALFFRFRVRRGLAGLCGLWTVHSRCLTEVSAP